jgi:ATP-dependent helicase/nuclease subunit A
MNRPVTITADIEARQRRAADPESSVWVSANAGSGKTYVLTERVLRLLLTGVAPDQILCLTYTKAAAAEMRKRVSARLAEWALLPDVELAQTLEKLEGRVPDAGHLQRARTLFAYALETPGGLKILTIHAFCESVLHRFPREAGIPFDFSVVEDNERDRMVQTSREAVIAEGLRGEGAAEAVATLFGLMSDFQIAEAIDSALADQRALRQVLADLPRARRNLRRHASPGRIPRREDVLRAMAEGYSLSEDEHAAIFAVAPPRPGSDGFVERLAAIDPDHPDIEALRRAFLTDKGVARKRLLLKDAATALPDIAEAVIEEAARLEQLSSDLVAADLVERSEALLDVLAAISGRYEAKKRARSLLDFDDLIEALRRLLANDEVGPWVRYKLDSGVTHILVDESQDTNTEQWQVIRLLADDFFDGEAAARRDRTLFAVGDKKQSIYSFQGADPEVFVDVGREYALQIRTAKLAFDEVPLKTSFRTLPGILEAVDRTFADAALREGILSVEAYEGHDSARTHGGGTVTLWPPVREEEEESDAENWPVEAPTRPRASAARQVAERIACEIKGWIETSRPLGPRGKAVEANDVLILVQTRGTLFREVIRALVRHRLPTPGADRLPVTSHIAVLDLMALGDVLLNPADDLQLAALLRSPLFDVSEEQLLRLAQPRPKGQILWAALAGATEPELAAAYRQLHGWRGRLEFDRPFEFFAGVLYADGGLRRFHARLGAAVDDVLAEFLDLALTHERSAQPSLQGFLAALRQTDITIKRELAESGGGVRVMTVHGAKGLEAPIVILADAASTEAGRTGKPVYLGGGVAPYLIHAGSRDAHTATTLEIRDEDEANQRREYWRKLYVAMTRAEDELYVTGALTKTGKLEGSWFEAIDRALRPEAESLADASGETALVFPRQRPAVVPAAPRVPTAPVSVSAATLAPLPAYRLRRIVTPSSAAPADPVHVLDSAAERLQSPLDPEAARRRGTALHALLQHLSRLDPLIRPAVARKALLELLPEAPSEHEELAARALAILENPGFAHIFGPDSRAEVPFLMRGLRDGVPVQMPGRIDRLVVEPSRVLVVDFKSDAFVPPNAAEVPPAYLTQLALYAQVAGQLFPDREIVAHILWTSLESLMILPLLPRVAPITPG